jgi:hypothetical protein
MNARSLADGPHQVVGVFVSVSTRPELLSCNWPKLAILSTLIG